MGTRMYVAPNGQRYPSVTTVIADHGKEAILEWRKKVGDEKANEISRKATTRGTSVHKALEKYLKNEDISSMIRSITFIASKTDSIPTNSNLLVQ
jgi:genome maintenance exonuclease 1